MHYNLVKASNRRYLEELKNRGHEMKPVYDAVNIMQETEWVINKPIYEVILSLINTDSSLGHLPTNPQEIELPVKPVDIETNKESLVKWKREASLVYKERAKSKSKYIYTKYPLGNKIEKRNRTKIWIPNRRSFANCKACKFF